MLMTAGQGAEMYGVEFAEQELVAWHARIAAAYGVVGDALIELKKAAIIRGDVLAVLDERTLLVQPVNGEPVALSVGSNTVGAKIGQAVDRRGILAGKRSYPTAGGAQRSASLYAEVLKFAYERFLEIQQRNPGHVAFTMLNSVARSRLMAAEDAARKQAAEEQRIQKLNDPRWQNKLISHTSAGSTVQPLADGKKPLIQDGQ